MHEMNLPPTLVCLDEYPNKLAAVTEFKIRLDDNGTNLSWRLITAAQIKICNDRILAEYKKLTVDIPIVCGPYPIFAEPSRPSYEFLAALYQKFLAYNDEDKLRYQFKKTTVMCHIRAHFLCEFLSHYGIATEKLIKFWNKEDWKSISSDQEWTFHAVTVIRDNKNCKWIWDPWEGMNQRLLPLKTWLYKANEPKLKKLMITSRAVLGDFLNGTGKRADGANFMRSPCVAAEYINAFQLICSDAMPNHPERSLSFSQYDRNRLFKAVVEKEREIVINTPAFLLDRVGSR
jgi:hypothetical protein